MRPAQTRKVAAMQAFFEYQPARMVKSGGPSSEEFKPTEGSGRPRSLSSMSIWTRAGGGDNLAAINSLKLHRLLRWGRYVELMITDERSDPI